MMKDVLQEILDWSEAWARLLPLGFLLIRKPRQAWVRPLKWYLVLAFLVNLAATVIWKRKVLGIDEWMQANLAFLYEDNGTILRNTLLYNLHSIFKFILFAWFFHCIGKVFRKMNLVLPVVVLLLITINFIINEDIRHFSSLLLATEAAILLIYCLVYYLVMLREEDSPDKRPPYFWVVTGLSIYVVINFPIFLFYNALENQASTFAVDIWDIHNISYIILCLFIAKSFYE